MTSKTSTGRVNKTNQSGSDETNRGPGRSKAAVNLQERMVGKIMIRDNERQESHNKAKCQPHLNGVGNYGMYSGRRAKA